MTTLTAVLTGFGFPAANAAAAAGAVVMAAPSMPITGCCTYNTCLSRNGTATGYDATLLSNTLSGVTSCTEITAL